MKQIAIVAAVRTPMGSFGGALRSLTATQLGAEAIKGALKKINLDPSLVSDVFMGCVIQSNLGQAPARQAAKFAGLADTVNCTTVNKVCASGMKAISMAVQHLLLGDASIVVAGGMESMSNTPFYIDSLRWGNKYGNSSLIDGLAKDGLTDVYDGKVMGVAAELCASTCGITRAAQDEFAIESYKRAQEAWEKGYFNAEVVPVAIPQRKGDPLLFEKDEEPFAVKFDKIPTLSPAFLKEGTITAANASTMNDGAAALVLMTLEKATELGIKPLAIIRGYADAEQAPQWFTTSPSLALPLALQKAGITNEEVDCWELNEAFSVVGIENARRLGIPAEKLNINGGAVALGHPLGCSGARIVVTLIHLLQRTKGKFGAAGICNGGGGASALVIENVA